jgi:hypothetical protein
LGSYESTVRALYLKRRRTLYEHQLWAIELLGMIRFEATDSPFGASTCTFIGQVAGKAVP